MGPDAGVTAIAVTSSHAHEIVRGLGDLAAIYGVTGVIILGLVTWLIIYTWKVWPTKAASKAAIDKAMAEAKAVESARQQAVIEINRDTIKASLEIIKNEIAILIQNFENFKRDTKADIDKIDKRVWDIHRLAGGGGP